MTRTTHLLRAGAVFAAALVAATAACGGDDDENQVSAEQQQRRDEAHDYYVERVHNSVGSCIGCHNGSTAGKRFMAEDAELSYTALERSVGLIAAPKMSPLVKHQHADLSIVVTTEQRALLSQWLGLEAVARKLEGAVEQPKTVKEAYATFADCMNFQVWSAFRMGDLAFAQTDSEGPCLGCHSTGQGSAFLNADSAFTFDKSKSFPFIQKFVVGKLDEKGSFEELQPSLRFAAKADEICPPESTSCHPRFGLSPQLRDAIDNFVNTTLQNIVTGQCKEGIVVPVSDAGAPNLDAGDGGNQ